MSNKFLSVSEFLYRRADRTEVPNPHGIGGTISLIDSSGKLNPKDITLFYRLIIPFEAYKIAIMRQIPIQYPHLAGQINKDDFKIASVNLFNTQDPKNFYALIQFQTPDGHIANIQVDQGLRVQKVSISR